MKNKLAKLTAVTLAASMVIGSSVTGMAASTNQTSEREVRNAQLSKEAAEEGMVLRENENQALPLSQGSKAALFGTGSYGTIKGGTGSGDVYNRYTISVYDALTSTYNISNMAWWGEYLKTFEEKKAQAAEEKKDNDYVKYTQGRFGGADSFLAIDQALTQSDMDKAKAGGVTTAFYTVSRVSGEGADRTIGKGDYELSEVEYNNIKLIAKNFDKCVVLLNVGGVVDTKFFSEIEGVDGLVLMSQAGMEGGNALADILTGKTTPSGKLTDTWAKNYSDYPAATTIGDNDGDNKQEDYKEGIYVGYRYFDTFNITPAYEFGYGKSYTSFDVEPLTVAADENNVSVTVNVTNTGDTYSGKEVVEVYFSAPDGSIEKPYQELAGFAKTDNLAPGESQKLTVTYKTTEMSSYDEAKAAYVMEDGDYIVRVGDSSRNTKVAGVLTLDKDVVTEQLSNQLTLDKNWKDLSKTGKTPYSYKDEAAQIKAAARIALPSAKIKTENNASKIDEKKVTTYLTADAAKDYKAAENEVVETVDAVPANTKLIDVYDGKVSMESFVASLDDTQLANLANGISGASTSGDTWGADANSVTGAAGETSQLYFNSLGIPNTVEADGPAGIRVTAETTDKDGNAVYNYCTAFPIGTLLAQTWNTDLVNRVGKAIGEEMVEIGVTLWLAPGMNIHRDPLCGRNFEYYSEDPALTGYVGSAITAGVQSNKGVGVTIKHYITNNQETNRSAVNTSVSERTLREIYLKGFEMVVKSAQPMAIMSSYNKVNGTYACENFDLLTSVPRGEWGFDGMVMTDWGAGNRAGVDTMMHAGNDLIMPGGASKANEIIIGAEDVKPTFEANGQIGLKDELMYMFSYKSAAWGDFEVSADGTQTAEAKLGDDYTASVGEDGKILVNGQEIYREYQANVWAGTGNYKTPVTTDVASVSEDGKTIVYKGTYKENNNICLGDVQKSAINNLKVIMQSRDMARIYGTTTRSYTALCGDLTNYQTVNKSEITTERTLKENLDQAKKDLEEAKKNLEELQKQNAAKDAEIAKAKAEVEAAKKDLQAAKTAAKKAAVKSVKSKKAGKAIVTVKKVAGAEGYQVQYSLKKSMKSAKNVKIKKNSITIKRLKKGKTYYVRVRAFSKDSNGKQIRTAWSTAKKVTIKK